MTREEFLEINDWCDLLDFDRDCEAYVCENVMNDYDLDEWLDNQLNEMCRENGWQTVREILNDIPDSPSGYYIANGGWDVREADDDDFEYYKDEILNYCDEQGFFDEEDENEEEIEVSDDYTDTDDEEPQEVEGGCSMDELLNTAFEESNNILQRQKSEKKLLEEEFNALVR